MRADLDEVLLTEEQIQQRLDDLACEIQRDYADRDLILVEIREIVRKLETRSLKFAIVLEKEAPYREDFRADCIAFQVPKKFVVGYDLHYREQYRNLPYVDTLKSEVHESHRPDL